MLMRYPRSPGSWAAILAWDPTQRRANCSLPIPGLRLRKATSLTIITPPSAPRHGVVIRRRRGSVAWSSAFDRPEGQAPHQEALEQQRQGDVRNDRHHRHGSELGPQDLV